MVELWIGGLASEWAEVEGSSWVLWQNALVSVVAGVLSSSWVEHPEQQHLHQWAEHPAQRHLHQRAERLSLSSRMVDGRAPVVVEQPERPGRHTLLAMGPTEAAARLVCSLTKDFVAGVGACSDKLAPSNPQHSEEELPVDSAEAGCDMLIHASHSNWWEELPSASVSVLFRSAILQLLGLD